MAVTYVTAGTPTTGATSILLNYPASIVRGNLLVMFIANKYPNNGPTLPAGWYAPANGQGSGGAGTAGADAGTILSTMFYKEAEAESGTITVQIPSGNSACGVIYQFTKATKTVWDVLCTNGADNAGGASIMSVTGAANLFLDAGDYIFVGFAINGDAFGAPSATTITATGCTFGTEGINSNTTTTGDDSAMGIKRAQVSTGPSSAAPVATATCASNTANGPAGSAVFMRIREAPARRLSMMGVG